MVAFHQSSGLCSAHPGRGVDSRIGAEAVAIIVPDTSTSNPLTDAVPTSIPIIHSLIYAIPSRSYPCTPHSQLYAGQTPHFNNDSRHPINAINLFITFY